MYKDCCYLGSVDLLEVALHGPGQNEAARTPLHAARNRVQDRLVALQASLISDKKQLKGTWPRDGLGFVDMHGY
jgi:hypothetical protein